MTQRQEHPVALEARGLVCRRGRGLDAFELRVDRLALHSGEVLVILGPNGAGKSTLLRALAGLDEHQRSGALESPGGGPTTLVFQRPAAFSGTVAHNVAAALLGKKLTDPERRGAIQRALARFEIEPLANHPARTLSGGELRRLALARAFVLEPRVLLLDEPFDDLDAEGQRALTLDLQRAIAETGVAVAMVTHDLRRALLLADRIAVLGEGRLAQYGSREEVLMHPSNQAIAHTVGMTNTAIGHVVRREDETTWVEIGPGFEVPTRARLETGEPAWIGIRPEHLKIDVGRGGGESMGKAKVQTILSDGLASVVTLESGDRTFITHLLSGRGLSKRLRPGDLVSLAVSPDDVHARALDATPSE